MLNKLLKHDMKTMARSAVPMLLTALAISVVCCAILFFSITTIVNMSENVESDSIAIVVGAMTSMGFYSLGVIGITVLTSLVALLALIRYYKALFTDEGYLNMVLPVKPSTMFNSKILSAIIWSLISGATMVVALIVSVVVPIAFYDVSILLDIAEVLSIMTNFFASEVPETGIIAVNLINYVLYSFESVFVIITAITLGGVIIRKHKVLGAIGFYFVITFLQESVLGIFTFFTSLSLSTHGAAGAMAASVFNLVVTVLVMIAMYVINYYILNKKFNIE